MGDMERRGNISPINQNGVDVGRSIVHAAVKSPAFKDRLGWEALIRVYSESLKGLGVPDEDVIKNTRSLFEALDSTRNHVAERIDVVNAAREAADKLREANNQVPESTLPTVPTELVEISR